MTFKKFEALPKVIHKPVISTRSVLLFPHCWGRNIKDVLVCLFYITIIEAVPPRTTLFPTPILYTNLLCHTWTVSPEFPGTCFMLSQLFSLHAEQTDSPATEICCACDKRRTSTYSTYSKGHSDPFNMSIHDRLASSFSLITRVTGEGQFGLPRNQAAGHWTRSRTSYFSLFCPVSGRKKELPLAIKWFRANICGIIWSSMWPLWLRHAAVSFQSLSSFLEERYKKICCQDFYYYGKNL